MRRERGASPQGDAIGSHCAYGGAKETAGHLDLAGASRNLERERDGRRSAVYRALGAKRHLGRSWVCGRASHFFGSPQDFNSETASADHRATLAGPRSPLLARQGPKDAARWSCGARESAPQSTREVSGGGANPEGYRFEQLRALLAFGKSVGMHAIADVIAPLS